MAKVQRKAGILGLGGSIGDKVYRQLPDGRTIVSRKPDFSQREFSQSQKDTQARFKRAVAYAREASRAQPIYALLAEGKPTNAYNLALSDWFKPPVIHTIERRGGSVWVTASDNIMVTEVYIKILDGEGNVLEQGVGISIRHERRNDRSNSLGSGRQYCEGFALSGPLSRASEDGFPAPHGTALFTLFLSVSYRNDKSF
jgi:hypothetical protein